MLQIIYIGSSGPLSTIPLKKLLSARQSVCAIAVDGDHRVRAQDRKIPVTIEDQSSVEFLAGSHGIARISLPHDWSSVSQEIAERMPDIIFVSCFGRRLPDALLSIPRMGCFNLHPSLLPAFRGPLPLFWQFRAGTREFGITLHQMTSQLDAGDVVGQSRVVMPDGVGYQKASELLGEAGGDLMVRAVSALKHGELRRSRQAERSASYQGFPSPSDYSVSVSWSARRLYNFVCATRDRGMRYPCRVGDRIYWLLDVDAWHEEAAPGVRIMSDRIIIPCRTGYVVARFQANSVENLKSGTGGGALDTL